MNGELLIQANVGTELRILMHILIPIGVRHIRDYHLKGHFLTLSSSR